MGRKADDGLSMSRDRTLKAMREVSEAISKLGTSGAVATDTTAYDIATAPAALPPITCSYCGGPVGADETHCPECAGEAPPIPFRYDIRP